jgi:hypothetical protein
MQKVFLQEYRHGEYTLHDFRDGFTSVPRSGGRSCRHGVAAPASALCRCVRRLRSRPVADRRPSGRDADADAAGDQPCPAVQARRQGEPLAAICRAVDARGWVSEGDGYAQWAGFAYARISRSTLSLLGTDVTGTGLKELVGIKGLKSLSFANSRSLTNEGLKELAGLKSLQSLSLTSDIRHGDAGLKELAGMTSLRSLDLAVTKVTDLGLKHLAGMKSLQSLDISGTDNEITDEGLKELAGLKSLQDLHICWTQITDVGLKQFAGLKGLQTLDVHGTVVSDAGLKELIGLKSLKSLDLRVTRVTDAGLKELVGLRSQEELDLAGTKVTDAGLKNLQKALPAANIHR